MKRLVWIQLTTTLKSVKLDYDGGEWENYITADSVSFKSR